MKTKKKKKLTKKERVKKEALRRGYLVILGTILLLGVSYAWFTLTLYGEKMNVLKAGTLSLVLDDTMGEGINIEGAVPMYDDIGLTQAPYTFTLTNDGAIESEYTIYLDDLDLEEGEERLSDSVIKYNLVRDGVVLATDFLSTTGESPNRVLDTGIIEPGVTYTYELRLWLDIDTGNEAMGKVFRGRIRVEASQVLEPVPTESGCFVYTKTATEVTITDYKCYEGNADGMPVITDVVIPRLIEGIEVTTIGASAFKEKGLTSVEMPRSITTLGMYAFESNQLTSVVIPNTITIISSNAFNKNQLTDIKIPASVTEIGWFAFGNNKLVDVTIPGTVKKLGGFNWNTTLEKVVIEEGVEEISSNAFAFGGNISSVEIPDSVTKIGSNAFRNNKLTNVKLPSGLKKLEDTVFYGNLLTELDIPEGVTEIGGSAFQSNRIARIVIPSTVTRIGGYAFSSSKLRELTIPDSVIELGEGAFWNNQLTNVIIRGKSSTSDFTTFGTDVFGWASGYSDDNIIWNG